MPRQRQRIVYCDCYDCVDRPAEATLPESSLKAAVAVARQEPPPKGLIVLASGLLLTHEEQLNLDSCTLPHLNFLVNEGNLGLLASRSVDEGSAAMPSWLHELAQLLGVQQELQASGGLEAQVAQSGKIKPIADRYKGMQALFASTSTQARQLASSAGLSLSAATQQVLDTALSDTEPLNSAPVCRLPAADALANAIVGELEPAQGASGPDLFVLHIDASDCLLPRAVSQEPGSTAGGGTVDTGDERVWDTSSEALEWLDSLVKRLMSHLDVRERTFTALVLSSQGRPLPKPQQAPSPSPSPSLLSSPGATLQQQPITHLVPGGTAAGIMLDPNMHIVTPGMAAFPFGASGQASQVAPLAPLVLRPLQSFEFSGQQRVAAQLEAPLLVVRRLPGVVRRDRAAKLSFAEAASRGGMGTVLLERLLPEVAYKLARAPKYGA